MISERETADDSEDKFIVIKNINNVLVPLGGTVVWAPGYRKGWANIPSAATLSLFAGVAAEIIGPGEYGRIQVKGFANALVDTSVASPTSGYLLKPQNASHAALVFGVSDGRPAFLTSADTWAAVAGTALKWCYVRGL
jgi:hypothetical protein